jgi:glutathione S-transferase
MLELWQAEWCPHSHRVRLRLTELELDWIARTVPVARVDRSRLEEATGVVGIPTLVDGDVVVSGSEEIVAYLATISADATRADRHRAQMRTEWPHWVELEGL